ncbi:MULTISPECIES: hypothetical protein [Natrinema]|uniref:Cox cluster protein n=2 Tax=Natrinema TaxID=88723 RepID=M0C2W7_9EURY|nr:MULTISPECIES: hypothetical protein [Natrinema]ELZ17530.1 hypothetical protein C476_15363 [Natrinema limicola JCM 13563]SDD98823.1 hypothetical protein SAMN05192552_10914 [Natrinema hispanicum]SEU14682.1 hypothetical protein SAMN04488694_1693 [Natrinema hispanicum]
MGDITRRAKYRFGQISAVLVLLFTLAFIPTGYDLWLAEPEVVVGGDLEPFSLTYNLLFLISVSIPIVVGLYLTRNIYHWSKNYQP